MEVEEAEAGHVACGDDETAGGVGGFADAEGGGVGGVELVEEERAEDLGAGVFRGDGVEFFEEEFPEEGDLEVAVVEGGAWGFGDPVAGRLGDEVTPCDGGILVIEGRVEGAEGWEPAEDGVVEAGEATGLDGEEDEVSEDWFAGGGDVEGGAGIAPLVDDGPVAQDDAIAAECGGEGGEFIGEAAGGGWFDGWEGDALGGRFGGFGGSRGVLAAAGGGEGTGDRGETGATVGHGVWSGGGEGDATRKGFGDQSM